MQLILMQSERQERQERQEQMVMRAALAVQA
jgi:hypothetical protein